MSADTPPDPYRFDDGNGNEDIIITNMIMEFSQTNVFLNDVPYQREG